MTTETAVPDPADACDLSVLVVCSANMCRSPIAAALLDEQARTAGLNWQIRSAGTHVRAGRRIDRYAVEVLAEVGIAPLSTDTVPLTSDLADAADLVLTADARIRQEVVSRHVRALRSSFTLLQFATLSSVVVLDDVDPSAIGPALLLGAGRARQRVQPALHGADDLADPYGHDLGHFRQARDTIQAAISDILRPIRRAVGTTPTGDNADELPRDS